MADMSKSSSSSLSDAPSSRYYTAMSEPAMVSWSTGEVRRMRSVLEMRLGVLACSSLDKSSLYALSCDANNASPLSLSPISPAVRSRRRSLSSSSSSASTPSPSSASSSAALLPTAVGVGRKQVSFSVSGASSEAEDEAENDNRLVDGVALDAMAPQPASTPAKDGAVFDSDVFGNREGNEGENADDCDLDVFGIPIPGTSRRATRTDHEAAMGDLAVGDDEEERADSKDDDLQCIRRNLLPQLVAFVAESPSKLDLSGLLC